MPQVQDRSINLLTCSPTRYHCVLLPRRERQTDRERERERERERIVFQVTIVLDVTMLWSTGPRTSTDIWKETYSIYHHNPYVYIQRATNREREREREGGGGVCVYVYEINSRIWNGHVSACVFLTDMQLDG